MCSVGIRFSCSPITTIISACATCAAVLPAALSREVFDRIEQLRTDQIREVEEVEAQRRRVENLWHTFEWWKSNDRSREDVQLEVDAITRQQVDSPREELPAGVVPSVRVEALIEGMTLAKLADFVTTARRVGARDDDIIEILAEDNLGNPVPPHTIAVTASDPE